MAKIWFHKILYSEKFSQISLILFFFAKVHRTKNLKIVHLRKFISQSFSYFSLSIFCIIKPHISNLKEFSKISSFAKAYLAKYFTLLNSRKLIQNILIFSPRESFSNYSNLKIGKINSVKIYGLHVSDFVSKFLKKYIKLALANILVFY